jgi:GTP-binding protein
MQRVNAELALFDKVLAEKPQIIAVNKIDLPEVKERLSEIKTAFHQAGVSVLFISAATGEGVDGLMNATMKVLDQLAARAKESKPVVQAVFHPQPRATGTTVHKEENVFVISAPELERIIARVDVNNPVIRQQISLQVVKMGIKRDLEKAGIKPGDKVRCGNFEWEW